MRPGVRTLSRTAKNAASSSDVTATSLRDVIADAIRERIVTGVIKPGCRIRDDEIARSSI